MESPEEFVLAAGSEGVLARARAALAQWCRSTLRTEVLPATSEAIGQGYVTFEWQGEDGRLYRACYLEPAGEFFVWMQVSEGAEGAEETDGLYFLRVNTLQEKDRALYAERAARRRDGQRQRQVAWETAHLAKAQEEAAWAALVSWFDSLGLVSVEPEYAVRIDDRIEFIWCMYGRYYWATYCFADRRFLVWVQVLSGVPGVTIIGGQCFLPANTRQQVAGALKAERSLR